MQETAEFLKAILIANGDDFLTNIFGARAKNSLKELGGVEAVAVALSGYRKTSAIREWIAVDNVFFPQESATVDDFAKGMGLSPADAEYIRQVLQAIAENDKDIIARLGIKGSAVTDMKFFVDKLVKTNFLD